jgi:hypothetical protein
MDFTDFSNIQDYGSKRNVVEYVSICWPGSLVDIATGYGMDGPGIEFRWGRDFPYQCRPTLGPTQPPVQWVQGFSRE